MARSEKYENLNKFKISYGLYVRNVRTKFIYIYYFFDLFGDKTYTFQKSDFSQKKQPKVKIFVDIFP